MLNSYLKWGPEVFQVGLTICQKTGLTSLLKEQRNQEPYHECGCHTKQAFPLVWVPMGRAGAAVTPGEGRATCWVCMTHYCPFPVPLKWPFRMNLTQTANALPFKRLFINTMTRSPSWPHSATKRPCTQWGQGASVPHTLVILSAYSFPASQRSFICVLQSDLALNCLLNQPITAKTNSGFSLSPVSSSTSKVSFLSPTLRPSPSLWHTRAIVHGNLSLLLQPSFWVALPHLPDFSVHAVVSESPHSHHSLHSFTSSTAAAAKSLQSCPTLCDPTDGSPPSLGSHRQALPSLGFSRQEHWSGLPLPSPSSTTTQPLRLRAKVTSSGEKFPNSQAK